MQQVTLSANRYHEVNDNEGIVIALIVDEWKVTTGDETFYVTHKDMKYYEAHREGSVGTAPYIASDSLDGIVTYLIERDHIGISMNITSDQIRESLGTDDPNARAVEFVRSYLESEEITDRELRQDPRVTNALIAHLYELTDQLMDAYEF